MPFILIWSISADTPPSYPNPIISMSSLLSELPHITDRGDSFYFCTCLGVKYPLCKLIHGLPCDNIKSEVMQILVEWYHRSPERSWDKVIDALFCLGNDQAAILLAERKGVDWKPLQSRWKKIMERRL